MASYAIKIGPWGGEGGEEWGFCTPPSGGIKEIVIKYGSFIDSIAFKTNSNAELKYGGTGGSKSEKIEIDWPNEYLTAISGTYSNSDGFLYITSLTFHTKLKTYGPIGVEGTHSFTLPMEGAAILGFHGRAGQFIDAIGVFAKVV